MFALASNKRKDLSGFFKIFLEPSKNGGQPKCVRLSIIARFGFIGEEGAQLIGAKETIIAIKCNKYYNKIMSWLVFSYSLSSKASSSQRVALWRRFKRLGALPHSSGVYILPEREDCLESFQWLVQEVQSAKGSASLMKVEKFESLADKELQEMFQKTSSQAYDAADHSIDRLEKILKKAKDQGEIKSKIDKIKNEFIEIKQTDFFNSPKSQEVLVRFNRLQQNLLQSSPNEKDLPIYKIDQYKNKTWVTRPKPHVDRLACAWLIRKFIDPEASIRYSHTPEPHEIPFDLKGCLFGHQGNLVSFETLIKIFHLKDPALKAMAGIIHEIDLRDSVYSQPETKGVEQILKGWIQANFSDKELESHGIALFEGLYTVFSRSLGK